MTLAISLVSSSNVSVVTFPIIYKQQYYYYIYIHNNIHIVIIYCLSNFADKNILMVRAFYVGLLDGLLGIAGMIMKIV